MNEPATIKPLRPEWGDKGVMAWRVTTENLAAVAEWTRGDVVRKGSGCEGVEFLVRGQTMNCGGFEEPLYDCAFPGDWVVLDSDTVFEAYWDHCFRNTYVVDE